MDIRKWLYKKPKAGDNSWISEIIRIYQKVFPCPHKYKMIADFKRECELCGDYQIYCYKKFGERRYEWISYNID